MRRGSRSNFGWIVLVLVPVMWQPAQVHSQQFRGQISAWENVQNYQDSEYESQMGVRYLPELAWDFTPESQFTIDTELSANVFANYVAPEDSSSADVKAYRLWLRFATHRFESRIGLQKINFGPAKLLRSLMWFDRLDPRDPLQLTEGVYALRLRYDFENLASIWLWGLYGNDEIKGLEFAPTKNRAPEFGGRFQHPAGAGEMALTLHYRTVDPSQVPSLGLPETRVALDGIWDVGVGLWFETALIHADYSIPDYRWQTFQTVGMDYTLPMGNGLHILGEHMLVTVSDRAFDLSQDVETTGLMASYPLSWLDQVALYSIYNWEAEMAYHYLSWQRTYDRWVLHISLFGRTGDAGGAFLNQPGTTMGKFGVQLMMIFNH